MNAIDALTQRVSANKYDTGAVLSREQIDNLIAAAMEAPSAFNIQHSRFLVVTSNAAKARLKSVAYNQQKIADAAATVIVLGDVRGHERMGEIVQRGVDANLWDAATADHMATAATGSYEGKPAFARDEALRSASMAAMNLMTAATAQGLATGPMIGFDPDALKKEFRIAERYLPVMLITVGPAAAGNWPRKPRLAPAEVAVVGVEPCEAHTLSE